MDLHIPNLKSYHSYREFFRDFVDINKRESPTRSRRFLARKLGWPVPLFDQLIAGQKRLTLRRCAEFSQVAGLDEFATDRLLFLTLADSRDTVVKRYARRRLTQGHDAYWDHTDLRIDCSPADGFHAILAFEVARFFKRPLTFAELTRRVPWLGQLNETTYSSAIENLWREGFISQPEGGVHAYLIRHGNINFTANPEDPWTDWARFFSLSFETLAASCKYRWKHHANSHGFAIFPLSRLQEVKDKFFEVRAWMESLEIKGPSQSGPQVLVQFCLGLVGLDESPGDSGEA